MGYSSVSRFNFPFYFFSSYMFISPASTCAVVPDSSAAISSTIFFSPGLHTCSFPPSLYLLFHLLLNFSLLFFLILLFHIFLLHFSSSHLTVLPHLPLFAVVLHSSVSPLFLYRILSFSYFIPIAFLRIVLLHPHFSYFSSISPIVSWFSGL